MTTTTTQRNISPADLSAAAAAAGCKSVCIVTKYDFSSPLLASPGASQTEETAGVQLIRSNVPINVRCYRIRDQKYNSSLLSPEHYRHTGGEDLGLSLAMFNVLRMQQSVCHEDLGVENCSSPSECLHTRTRHRSNEGKMMREAHQQYQHSPRQLSLRTVYCYGPAILLPQNATMTRPKLSLCHTRVFVINPASASN